MRAYTRSRWSTVKPDEVDSTLFKTPPSNIVGWQLLERSASEWTRALVERWRSILSRCELSRVIVDRWRSARVQYMFRVRDQTMAGAAVNRRRALLKNRIFYAQGSLQIRAKTGRPQMQVRADERKTNGIASFSRRNRPRLKQIMDAIWPESFWLNSHIDSGREIRRLNQRKRKSTAGSDTSN